MLGRRLRGFYPQVPLAREHARSGSRSCPTTGSIDFGLLGDYDALPDLDALAAELGDAIGELAAAAGVGDEVARATGARRRRRRGRRGRGRSVRRRAAGHDGGHARCPLPPLRLALAQINARVGDLEGNARGSASGSPRARDAGAELVLFPELALTGYPPEDLLLKEHFLRPRTRGARASSRGRRDGDRRARRLPGARRGRLQRARRARRRRGRTRSTARCCLPNYGVFDEQRYFQAGDGGARHRPRRARASG